MKVLLEYVFLPTTRLNFTGIVTNVTDFLQSPSFKIPKLTPLTQICNILFHTIFQNFWSLLGNFDVFYRSLYKATYYLLLSPTFLRQIYHTWCVLPSNVVWIYLGCLLTEIFLHSSYVYFWKPENRLEINSLSFVNIKWHVYALWIPNLDQNVKHEFNIPTDVWRIVFFVANRT